ncbi:MAG: M17 family peptidase N-terminal domain-containing protein, partial [Polyangiales bacterium]
MIAYDFVSAAPRSLDELQAELIVLPFFSDERPLAGAAGLIDWRLCGALSRKLMAGYLDGSFGEKALLTNPGTLKSEGLLLVGLGDSSAFDRSV